MEETNIAPQYNWNSTLENLKAMVLGSRLLKGLVPKKEKRLMQQ